MQKTYLKLIFILLIVSTLTGSAQSVKQVKFDAITIEDGLSQGMVNSILQDRYGFMWFASNDGLNRYDGYHFTVYKNDPAKPNSIAENFIRFIFEDSKGRLWIATAGNGLDLFNRTTETFVHFKHSATDPNSLSDNSVTAIREDKLGGIWVGTIHGLNRLSITDKKSDPQADMENKDATSLFLAGHSVSFSKIIFDAAHPALELFSRNDQFPLADWRASNFYVDQQGLVWVSVQGQLFRIKPMANQTCRVEKLPIAAYSPSLQKDFVTCVHRVGS